MGRLQGWLERYLQHSLSLCQGQQLDLSTIPEHRPQWSPQMGSLVELQLLGVLRALTRTFVGQIENYEQKQRALVRDPSFRLLVKLQKHCQHTGLEKHTLQFAEILGDPDSALRGKLIGTLKVRLLDKYSYCMCDLVQKRGGACERWEYPHFESHCPKSQKNKTSLPYIFELSD